MFGITIRRLAIFAALAPLSSVTTTNAHALQTPEQERAAHIARRIMNGGTKAEIDALAVTANVDALIDAQLNPPATETFDPTIQGILDSLEPDLSVPGQDWVFDDLVYKQIIYNIYSQYPLREVMTQFWEEHFNTYYDKVFGLYFPTAFILDVDFDGPQGITTTYPVEPYDDDAATIMAIENQTFRDLALGKFKDLLFASAKSPAMILYLDGVANVADPANENYARELLELHTVGKNFETGKPDNYNQDDINAIAIMARGWSVKSDAEDKFVFQFRDGFAQDTPTDITLFTKWPSTGGMGITIPTGSLTGQAELEAVLEELAKSPETAEFISRKLIANFVSDEIINPQNLPPGTPDPNPELTTLLNACIARWATTDGDISEVLDEILKSNAFKNNAAYRWNKVRQPFEYMVSLVRRYSTTPIQATTDLDPYLTILENDCKQLLFRVPAPDGESRESLSWCTTGQMMHRARMANLLFSGVVSGDPLLNYAGAVPYDFVALIQSLGADMGNPRSVASSFMKFAYPNYYTTNDARQAIGFLSADLDGNPGGTPLATLIAQGTPAAEEEYAKRIAQMTAMILGRSQASLK